MNQKEVTQAAERRSDGNWNRVYIAVVITTVIVVAALWAFGKYFS